MQRILDAVRALDGVLELAPAEGSGFPELAWGDHFFYYAPDGKVPEREQPYATIVTKDYPDDTASDLGGEGRWRLNVHVGKAVAAQVVGGEAGAASDAPDFSASDVFLPHPVYGPLGWIAVVVPGERTCGRAVELLRDAHEQARKRAERRAAVGGAGSGG
ncbi:DUF6194 family protein [Nocardiopsis suaedae]|uniref:DUF6194 family protein n=1 Tax=Nocardiopsis suaedae TaxID=3018444 RepID=A0ABT4TUD2_9ACTN|nr:DUF6194 family protein [Nocardiopsis suaedae]MDA2808313.1 DUF6194 family protein [Nocardiopsis suaedae]